MFSVFVISFYLLSACEASNILAIFPMQYKSHFLIGSAIVKELADKGHHITLISPYELKYSNVDSVNLNNLPKGQKSNFYKLFALKFSLKFQSL